MMTNDDHVRDVEDALSLATEASAAMRRSTPRERAGWLESAAEALEASREELVTLAAEETHLPRPRLEGELTRTTFQARLFAQRLRQGRLTNDCVDPADPDWGMGPRPDIRRTHVPVGPVAVFAASNFPFAFSVFGGDTVSAVAAGCPVVLKAHPGHPELSRSTARIVGGAMAVAGAPEGSFSLVKGETQGVRAVEDPRVRAVAFTGSVSGGRALFDRAVGRPDPIPFHGELGSVNPVVVTPVGWARRAADIAEGFAASFTLGSGQFCTKPGLVLVPEAADFVAAVPLGEVGPMLNDRIESGYRKVLADLVERPGVELVAGGDGPDRPALLQTNVSAIQEDPSIVRTECFGPAAIVCEYRDDAQLEAVLGMLEGSLSVTVQGAEDGDDDEIGAALLDRMVPLAGRLVWNQWPTGVTVSDAQQHGGPWPSTTSPNSTSVGTAAVWRFLRPVAYQNVPQGLLPAALRDGD